MKKRRPDKLHRLFYGQSDCEIKGLEQLVWDRMNMSIEIKEALTPYISVLLRVLYYAVKDRDYDYVYTIGRKLCIALGLHWPTVSRSFELYWNEEKYHV